MASPGRALDPRSIGGLLGSERGQILAQGWPSPPLLGAKAGRPPGSTAETSNVEVDPDAGTASRRAGFTPGGWDLFADCRRASGSSRSVVDDRRTDFAIAARSSPLVRLARSFSPRAAAKRAFYARPSPVCARSTDRIVPFPGVDWSTGLDRQRASRAARPLAACSVGVGLPLVGTSGRSLAAEADPTN